MREFKLILCGEMTQTKAMEWMYSGFRKVLGNHTTSGRCEWDYTVDVESPIFTEGDYCHVVRLYKKSGELVAAAIFDKFDL